MKEFTDTEGRKWVVAMTVAAARRVLDLVDVNLMDPAQGDPPLLTRLGTDVMLLVDVIFAVVKPQADQRNISDEDFGAALGGDVVLAARTAFFQEMSSFFESLGRRDIVQAMASQNRLVDAAISLSEQKIAEFPMDQELARIYGGSPTKPPAESESTPDQ